MPREAAWGAGRPAVIPRLCWKGPCLRFRQGGL